MLQAERVNSEFDARQSIIDETSANIHVSIPAKVTAVDLERQVVSLKPTVQARVRGKDGAISVTDYPVITECPIVYPRGGGFALTFPINVGDECLAVFSDSCIDFWWQSGGVQSPQDERRHDLSDCIALFGVTSQPRKLPSVQADAIELRTESRSDYISLQGSNININISGTATVNASKAIVNCPVNQINGNVTISGATVIQGGLSVSGGSGATVTGSVTATGDVTGGSVSLKSHKHTGVTKGSSMTGIPMQTVTDSGTTDPTDPTDPDEPDPKDPDEPVIPDPDDSIS
jgi:hypothetical protein